VYFRKKNSNGSVSKNILSGGEEGIMINICLCRLFLSLVSLNRCL